MKKVEKSYLLKTSQEPWQEISINIVEPLPRLNDKNAIVVIVDWFTKIIRLKATIIAVLLKEIVKIYSNIWKIYRVSNMSTVSLKPHLLSTSLLVSLPSFSSSDIYHICLYIFPCLLLSLTISIFSLPTALSSVFFYILLLIYLLWDAWTWNN